LESQERVVDVEHYLKEMGVRCWRKNKTRDRDAWKLIPKETKVLHGLYRQWEEREGENSAENNIVSEE
jgi:hypothetical protein